MNVKKQKQKPWEQVNNNLIEFIKLWKAAHESVLGFHWKKLPPFSFIWPQVDFLRIQSLMADLSKQCSEQIRNLQVLIKKSNNSVAEEQLFYKKTIPYLHSLQNSAKILIKIAAFKQSKLEKKQVKARDLNRLLKDYEAKVAELRNNSLVAREQWLLLNSALSEK